MSRKPSLSDLERRLRDCEREYEAVKGQLHDVGFICTGSLAKRWMVCGKPNCHCSTDPSERHGPYYQLTWKEGGVTVTRNLHREHARLYQEWIANRRRLDSLLTQMYRVSTQAARHLLRAATDPPSDPEEPPQRARSRKKS